MPLATSTITLTNTAWTLVADGAARCVMQLTSSSPVRIYVGPSAPADNAPSITLHNKGDRSLALDGLTTEKVYARGCDAYGALAVLKG